MTKTPVVLMALAVLAAAPLVRAQDDQAAQPFSPDELDNLLAPVALYPDPLLAQVLLSATFPDQVDEAARFCRAGADPNAIDVQPWDVSVKAVAHYPTVLYMMADRLDWTTAMGQAYVNQADDVMASIQRLRQEARAAGNLESTPEEEVHDDGGDIDIWPAQPQYVYVPEYDPSLVFFGSGGVYGGPVVSFSVGYPIGVWLNVDWDWHHHRIYYHGWSTGHGWIARSRPYVHINNAYVNSTLKNVIVNRGVVGRAVNYNNLTRYSSVHQNVGYGGRAASGGEVNNKIIQRNMNVSDPRINTYRGNTREENPAVSAPAREAETQRNFAFGGERGNFTPRDSSQRGQASRAQPVHSAPPPHSSSPSVSHGGGGGGGGGGSHAGGGGGGGGGKH